MTSPGIGSSSDPAAAAAAAAPIEVTPSAIGAASDDPFAQLPFADRPEIQIGIAFAGTFVLAKLLKSLAS